MQKRVIFKGIPGISLVVKEKSIDLLKTLGLVNTHA